METFIQVAYISAALMLFYQGTTNITWSIDKERQRIEQILNSGLRQLAYKSGLKIIVLASLISIGSSVQPEQTYWFILGVILLLFGAIGFLVVTFTSTSPLNEAKIPSNIVLNKRVAHRRLAGILFIIGGIVWSVEGMTNAFS